MLSLEQVKMFVLSAELGSFSACARKMGKVQSAVSHGINTLEIDLGIELFNRTARNPTLTPAGERLIRSAKNLLAQADEFEDIAQSMERNEESQLTIAIDDGVYNAQLANLFKRLDTQFPTIQIDVLSLASGDISAEVATGNADIGIMFTEVEAIKQVDFCYVGSIDFLPVCHPDYPLADISVQLQSDLTPFRQLAVRGKSQVESQALISIAPKVWWSSSHYSVLELVKQQVGWAYLPSFLVENLIVTNELHKVNVPFDHKPWNAPVDLVFKKGRANGPVFQWLFDELKQIFTPRN
ncbi:LysR family transcriptional regulator [Vibrio mytili]|uniref:LysR family transcriptional regulator n=1 Tax=Vibrio mytili TaxID=50718 RepID=A0A0C3I6H9_9VIBR|nr:LysR family transcriptional regulator [Vibrio mytili]KIN10610.1 LysR family transcriptional regulator [Vibrio mytili]